MQASDSISALQKDRLLLSMQMVFDDLEESALPCEAFGLDNTPRFHTVRIFRAGTSLLPGTLYLLPDETVSSFPRDLAPYIAVSAVPGSAPHILCEGCDLLEVMEQLQAIFDRYHEFETTVNAMCARGCDLDDLCQLGFHFFHNPMYIHDQYFSVLSHPYWIQGMLQMEYNEKTGTYSIPISLIEDFKFNEQYRETLDKTEAAIWGVEQYPIGMRSLYVNLLDEGEYIGRLLINELNTPLLPGQMRSAEYFARRIVYTMQRFRQSSSIGYRGHEETLRLYLQNEDVESADLAVLRTALGWSAPDTYLCFCIAFQEDADRILSEGVLRSRISSMFHNNINFFDAGTLCFVLNLDISGLQAAEVRHRLSPLVRDSLLYCGLSDPVDGYDNLPHAYTQALSCLGYCRRRKNEQWLLSFERCAGAYIRDHLRAPLPDELLASHSLKTLIRYDKAHGTEYYTTLRAYLQHDLSIPQTARALIIHRTTLQYRLEKIFGLVHLTLDDPDEKLYLLFSFRLLDEAIAKEER